MIITRPRFALAPDQGGTGGGTRTDGQADDGKTTPASTASPTGKDQQDTAGTTPETTDDDLPNDPEQLKAALKKSRSDFSELLKTHTEMKGKAERRVSEEEKAHQAALKEQGKFKELYEAAAPKLELFTKYEASLTRYLETELKSIPENLKALMPEGDPASQLEWIAKAKSAGAVQESKAAPKKTGDGTPPPGSGSASVMTRAEFDRLPADKKLAFSKAGGKLTD